jgi:hypothetical protein
MLINADERRQALKQCRAIVRDYRRVIETTEQVSQDFSKTYGHDSADLAISVAQLQYYAWRIGTDRQAQIIARLVDDVAKKQGFRVTGIYRQPDNPRTTNQGVERAI